MFSFVKEEPRFFRLYRDNEAGLQKAREYQQRGEITCEPDGDRSIKVFVKNKRDLSQIINDIAPRRSASPFNHKR